MVAARILKKASELALKRKKKRDIIEKESIATAKKKKEGIKELKKQPSPKGLSSSPARETAAAQEALGKKSVTSQAQKGYRGEIKNIAVESKTPKAGKASPRLRKLGKEIGGLESRIRNAKKNPVLKRALARDKRFGTIKQMESKVKKLKKARDKFTGPRDVTHIKKNKTKLQQQLDKIQKLNPKGNKDLKMKDKVKPKPQKGPTRPINPEERSGRDYRIDVNRKREPEFFRGKDPYDPKKTSGPTNIEYAKKKKLKSGRKVGDKERKNLERLKVDQKPKKIKQPIDPRDIFMEGPYNTGGRKGGRGMGKALRGGGKVMRGR